MAIDIQNEDNIERLREITRLLDSENAYLHERIAELSNELEQLEEQKRGRLQRELTAVKQHLAKLQKIQFGASSEKRDRDADDSGGKRRRRRKRKRSGTTPQPDLPVEEETHELDEADKICPECAGNEVTECSWGAATISTRWVIWPKSRR